MVEVFKIEPKDEPYFENKEARICSCGGVYYKKDYGAHLADGTHNKRVDSKKSKKFGLF